MGRLATAQNWAALMRGCSSAPRSSTQATICRAGGREWGSRGGAALRLGASRGLQVRHGQRPWVQAAVAGAGSAACRGRTQRHCEVTPLPRRSHQPQGAPRGPTSHLEV